METERTKRKYQSELKWGSYYFITALFFSFSYSLIKFLIINQFKDESNNYIALFSSFVFICFFIFVFIYFLSKCIQEIKSEKRVNFFLKLGIALRIYLILYILAFFSFINSVEEFIIPKCELEIQEANG
ncbi:hypothetical protein [Flavobacterium granuli]|uniref:Drug/metabolite transporter (DMT)-like permease n=1 Tax=Flavobacterium granuli TaxID=280093 RepID=A0ABU1S3V6_9FLAO|nr:hypothetical protein [Flavobacterium granuli]MDR6845622.1 drug/metabolite transporter (DMT)-like permease [Flavobacterium granuli]